MSLIRFPFPALLIAILESRNKVIIYNKIAISTENRKLKKVISETEGIL